MARSSSFKGNIMTKILYIHNLSRDMTQAQLLELFSTAGEVLNVFLISDRWTSNPKGYGFVQMATEATASKAVKLLNGTKWLSRTLLVRQTAENDSRLEGLMSNG